MTQIKLFEYDQISEIDQGYIQDRTVEIKALVKKSAQDIVKIGLKLIEVKDRLPHGIWGKWLDTEFGWGQDTAIRFMSVAVKFRKLRNLDNFGQSALYLLSAPSTPDEARKEALERAKNGEIITHKTAKAIVNDHKKEKPLFHCPKCDMTFNTEVWHCLHCNHHWQLDQRDCPNCYKDGLDQEVISHPKTTDTRRVSAKSNNIWYTPLKYIESVRFVLERIDLDPASCIEANEVIRATSFFTEEMNGLNQKWGGKVWLNPPYGRIASDFAIKLIDEYKSGNVESAILLINSNTTDTNWFQPLWDYTLCFTDHRIDFNSPNNINASGSTHGSLFVYFGENINRFYEEFRQYGTIVRKYNGKY